MAASAIELVAEIFHAEDRAPLRSDRRSLRSCLLPEASPDSRPRLPSLVLSTVVACCSLELLVAVVTGSLSLALQQHPTEADRVSARPLSVAAAVGCCVVLSRLLTWLDLSTHCPLCFYRRERGVWPSRRAMAVAAVLLRSAFVCVWLAALALVVWLDATWEAPWLGCASDVGPFCERERPSRFMRERSNALSDFAFLALGLALICTAIEDTLSPPTVAPPSGASAGLSLQPTTAPCNVILRYPSLTLLYGLANVVHACGTWLNHSSRCHLGHRLDLTGMWLVSFFCSLASASRLLAALFPAFCQTSSGAGRGGGEAKNVLPTFFFPLYLLAGWAFWLLSDVWYADGSYDAIEPRLVIANIAIVAVAEAAYLLLALRHNSRRAQSPWERYSGRYDVLAVGASSIALGAVLGRLDATGALCWPDSALQFHAVWHVLACVCLACLYVYYRLEHTPDSSVSARKVR